MLPQAWRSVLVCWLAQGCWPTAQAQPSAPKATKAASQAAGMPDKTLLRQILQLYRDAGGEIEEGLAPADEPR